MGLILDNNGIIKRSKDARREYGQAKTNEQEQLDSTSDWIEEQVTGKVPLAKVSVDTKAKKNGTINGEEGNSNNPTIPEGYTPINTTTSEWGDGSTTPDQDAVDHGLVIKDDKDNEWVWIPVDSETLATMYETSSDEKTLCGTSGDTAVTTNKYSKSEIIEEGTRVVPGTSGGFREPDIVVGYNNGSYDAKAQYYKDTLGFDSKEEMAKAFVDDYNEMIASIAKYGGFYIGRYELSEEGVQKGKEPLGKTMNWYRQYNKCKELNASDKVETRMIWGCQWDVTCKFIANKGDQKDITNSCSWGNYYDSTGDAAVKVIENETEIKKYGSRQNTGYSEYWKANNIYDFAGNCKEWTQEARSTDFRVLRGGVYNNIGSSSNYSVSSRSNGSLGYPGAVESGGSERY